MFRNDLLNPSVAVVIWENQATRQGAAVGDAHHGPVSVSVAVRVNERAAAELSSGKGHRARPGNPDERQADCSLARWPADHPAHLIPFNRLVPRSPSLLIRCSMSSASPLTLLLAPQMPSLKRSGVSGYILARFVLAPVVSDLPESTPRL